MRIFIESQEASDTSGVTTLGTYAEVATAIHALFPKRRWHTARSGVGIVNGHEVEIFITTRKNQKPPPKLEKLLFQLFDAKVPMDLVQELSAALVTPDEKIMLVGFNKAEPIIDKVPEWASQRKWRAKHWPDGPEIKNKTRA